MAQNEESGGLRTGNGIVWAFLSPVLVAAGFFIFPFVPAICVYLDGRSRTYAAAASVVAGCVALPALFGAQIIPVCAFILIATTAAYVLTRTKIPFSSGMVYSAACGVLGSAVLLGLLGAGYDRPLNEVAASFLCNGLSGAAVSGYPEYLKTLAGFIKAMDMGQYPSVLWYLNPDNYLQLVSGLPVSAQLDIVRPVLERLCAAYIPALALVGGMFSGALGYYLPVLALDRRRRKKAAQPDGEQEPPVPPFTAFRIPKYVFISLVLLQLVSDLIATADNPGLIALDAASKLLFNALMIIQALALLSFLMNRGRVRAVLQFIIFVPVVLLLSSLLVWVGIFDAIFDIRSVVQRMETLRAKGKQVFTQEGLEELRKMEQRRKDGKDSKDGKDGREGGAK
jgi:hypothetical protein